MITRKKIWTIAVALLTVMFLFAGCAQSARWTNQPEQDVTEIEPDTTINDMNRSGIYDSEDAIFCNCIVPASKSFWTTIAASSES